MHINKWYGTVWPDEMCRTSALPDGLAMVVSLKNLIIFAS